MFIIVQAEILITHRSRSKTDQITSQLQKARKGKAVSVLELLHCFFFFIFF